MPVACASTTLVIKLPSVSMKISYLFASHEFFIAENGDQRAESGEGGGARRSLHRAVARRRAPMRRLSTSQAV